MKNNPMTKEQRLNEFYSEAFTLNQVLDQLNYLTNKARGSHVTVNRIFKAYRENTIGTLLKKYDPIAFNCAD